MNPPALQCRSCGQLFDVAQLVWRCPCGGLLDVSQTWRPSGDSVLPVPVGESITLGEGNTPMIPSRTLSGVRLKLEFFSPTLSFKDRGSVVLASLAAHLGVGRAVVDSTGNAGTAAAAYFARAGIDCEVLVPASTSPEKLAQIAAHGAALTLVPGSRADAAAAAAQIAGHPGVFYASHVYHPYFVHGVKAYGYEIWQQSGHTLPSAVLVPVGNGTLLLGCYLAFSELIAAGLADRMPALLGVQAAGCAPLAAAWDGRDYPVGPTVAEGIAITAPPAPSRSWRPCGPRAARSSPSTTARLSRRALCWPDVKACSWSRRRRSVTPRRPAPPTDQGRAGSRSGNSWPTATW